MNKEVYIKTLKRNLSGVPKDDIEEAAVEVHRHIEAGVVSGKSESEIIGGLIEAKALAKIIRAEYEMDTLSLKLSCKKVFLVIGLLLSLGFVNIVFLPVIISVIALVACLYLLVLCLYTTGVLLIITPLVGFFIPILVSVPEGGYILMLPMMGMAVMVVTRLVHKLMNGMAKHIFKGVIKYLKLNLAAFKA